MKFKWGRTRSIALLLYCFIVIFSAGFLFKANLCKAEEPVLVPETGHLVIDEVYPYSDGTYKDKDDITRPIGVFIELINIGPGQFDTTGCTIKDASSVLPKEIKSIVMESGDYLLLKPKEDFSFSLNYASPEMVTLTCGSAIDTLSYSGTKSDWAKGYSEYIKGYSISRIPNGSDTDLHGGFQVTVPTPGEVNVPMEKKIIDEDTTDNPIDIVSAREEENGKEVTVSGTVTALPGILSSQYFYIQDETGGIQIYCYGKTFPNLALGDVVLVSGELSQTNNERRVKITSADKIVIQNHTDPIAPTEISISDISEKTEGTYVKTAGIVTETSGDTFYISDGQKDIKVVINKSTGIDKPKMKKGDQVEVTGIVSQYKDEYRILPIDQDDVKIVASEGQLPRAGIGELVYFIISLFLSIIWNIYLGAKRKLTA